MQKSFKPFIQNTVEIIIDVCRYGRSTVLVTSGCKMLSMILECVKDEPETLNRLCKYFIELLIE